MNITPQQLIEKSWEALPCYGNATDFETALAESTGNCMHRSIVIGRAARQAGMLAMRKIVFGAGAEIAIPHSFGNYIFHEGRWLNIYTGHKFGSGGFKFEKHDFGEGMQACVGNTTEGFIPLSGADRITDKIPVMAIPEAHMSFYRGLTIAKEYFKQSVTLAESARCH